MRSEPDDEMAELDEELAALQEKAVSLVQELRKYQVLTVVAAAAIVISSLLIFERGLFSDRTAAAMTVATGIMIGFVGIYWVRHAFMRGFATGARRDIPEGQAFPVPHGAELCLLFLLPKHHRESFPGDLEQEFRKISRKHGALVARRWYWWQALLMVAKTLPLSTVSRLIVWMIKLM